MKKNKDSNYYDKMSDKALIASITCIIASIAADAAKKHSLSMGLRVGGFALAVVSDRFMTKQKQEILNEIKEIEKREVVKPKQTTGIDIVKKAEEAMNEIRKLNEANVSFIKDHFDYLSDDEEDDDNDHDWQA